MRKANVPNRGYRVADQIQRDLGELIARELKDPRVRMVTLTSVEVSADYAHATVFFSQLGGEARECEAALNHAAGFLRNCLFRRLQIHTVPSLHFVYDPTTASASRMHALIARAVSTAHPDNDLQQQ